MMPFEFLEGLFCQRLTWALLHFLWQGFVVAGVMSLLLWWLRSGRAESRYMACLAGLLWMAACPALTFSVLESRTARDGGRPLDGTVPPHDFVAIGAEADYRPAAEPAPAPLVAPRMVPIQPYVLAGWAAGVLLLGLKLLFGLAGLRHFMQGRRAVPVELAGRAAVFGKHLGLRKCPTVFLSEKVSEAIAIGFVRPMVLLPAAWLLEMTPEVLEAVIAHELAHLRRGDLWVNLLQRVIEALLFYHPAVWWLSRRIRLERELCCDGLAVAATGRQAEYLRALQWVAQKRTSPTSPRLEAAMGGSDMALLNRVRHLIGLEQARGRMPWWPAGLAVMATLAGLWSVACLPTGDLSQAQAAEQGKPLPPARPDPPPPRAVAPAILPRPPQYPERLAQHDSQQILLAIKLVEIDEGELKDAGVDFLSASIRSSGIHSLMGVCNDNKLLAVVASLRKSNRARVLAEPTLVMISGQSGCFHAGGEVPLWTESVDGQLFQRWEPYGTKIAFLPHLIDNERIRLEFRWEYSEVDSTKTEIVAGKQNPAIRRWAIDTGFEFNLGRTLVAARHSALSPAPVKDSRRLTTLLLVTPEVAAPASLSPSGPGRVSEKPCDPVREKPVRRDLSIRFVGNSAVSRARLQAEIKTKPGPFRGGLDGTQLKEDAARLTAYYRFRGYFRAKVNGPIYETGPGDTPTAVFLIDEGPRFRVNKVCLEGVRAVPVETIRHSLELRDGGEFDQEKMTADVARIRDVYRRLGYSGADAKVDVRLLEGREAIDLVFQIDEGAPRKKKTVGSTGNAAKPEAFDDEERVSHAISALRDRGATVEATSAPPQRFVRVEFRDTHLSEKDILHLATLDEHRYLLLILRGETFTDEDALRLMALKGLRRLALPGTSVTENVVGRLHEAAPQLAIQRTGGPLWDTGFADGCTVQHLLGGGAAERAQIHEGDRITSFDGKPIREPSELVVLIARKKPGDVVPVEVLRQGKAVSVSLQVGAWPDNYQ